MDADQFMADVKPARRRSPLHEHADAIQQLRAAGYTYDQILQYLKSQGVSVSKTRLCNFVMQDLEQRPRTAAAIRETERPPQQPTPAPKPLRRAQSAAGDPTPEQIQEFTRLAQLGLKRK